MGIFDKVSKFVSEGIDKTIPTLSVCMMGPRSVGKTTVMTSLFSESQSHICEGSRLYLNALDNNTAKLNNYRTMLMDAVAKKTPQISPHPMLSQISCSGLALWAVNHPSRFQSGTFLESTLHPPLRKTEMKSTISCLRRQ